MHVCVRFPLAALVLLPLVGMAGSCSRSAGPPTKTAPPASSRPAGPPAPVTTGPAVRLLPEAQSWSREEALAHLADESARLSAAVRLVRLSEAQPLVLPDPLPPANLGRLRVVKLSEVFWVLGWDTGDAWRLAAPILIDRAGAVSIPTDAAEEEASVLCISRDADLFPHLLLTPKRVLLVGDEIVTMLVGKALRGCRFAVRQEDGYWYLALVLPRSSIPASQPASAPPGAPSVSDARVVEVARYEWDPYEEAFSGPALDQLPDPPGGDFELDVEASEGLVPVGGDLPQPPPLPPAGPRGEPTPF